MSKYSSPARWLGAGLWRGFKGLMRAWRQWAIGRPGRIAPGLRCRCNIGGLPFVPALITASITSIRNRLRAIRAQLPVVHLELFDDDGCKYVLRQPRQAGWSTRLSESGRIRHAIGATFDRKRNGIKFAEVFLACQA